MKICDLVFHMLRVITRVLATIPYIFGALFVGLWGTFKGVWNLFTSPLISMRKKKLVSIHNTFDPFKEIARNGKNTILYTHGGDSSLATCGFSAIGRVMNEYRVMGKSPIAIYIGQDPHAIPQRAKESGLNMIEYPLRDAADPLKALLRVQETFHDCMLANYVLFITHSGASRSTDIHQWYDIVLPVLLTKISSDPNNVCLIIPSELIPVVPEIESLYTKTEELLVLLNKQKEENPSLNMQFMYPRTYQYLHIRQDECPNKVLFPMYHYEQRNQESLLDGVLAAFPHADHHIVTKCFWDYHQTVYDVKGKTGVYLLEAEEVDGRKLT